MYFKGVLMLLWLFGSIGRTCRHQQFSRNVGHCLSLYRSVSQSTQYFVLCHEIFLYFFFFKESTGVFLGIFKKNSKLLEAKTQSEVRVIFYMCYIIKIKRKYNADNLTFIFHLQNDLLVLGSADNLAVNNKVSFGEAFLRY